MNRPPDRRPLAHVPAAAFVSCGLAMLLAGGMRAIGVLGRMDAAVTRVLWEGTGRSAGGVFPKELPEWAGWVGGGLLALGLAWAMLGVTGGWRRLVLWVSALVLTVSWAPVLALAAHVPAVSGAAVMVAWAGLCAWVYGRTHRLPGELESRSNKNARPAAR